MYVYQPRPPRRKVDWQIATPKLPPMTLDLKDQSPTLNTRVERVKGMTAREIYRMAKAIYRSVTIQSDLEDAIFYFKMAADMDYPPAQNMYAFCLDQRLNDATAVYGYFSKIELGDEDFVRKEMIRYYRLACEAEHKRALNNLGICYIQGNGVPVNIEVGVSYLYRSKQAGDRLGARNYDAFTANHSNPNRKATFAYGRR
jgi:TPR repeat protein